MRTKTRPERNATTLARATVTGRAIVATTIGLVAVVLASSRQARAQTPLIRHDAPRTQGTTAAAAAGHAPRIVTLGDALALAAANSPELQAAASAMGDAHAARIEALAGLLPNATFNDQMLYTQPNGTPSGVFIANNGTREYVSQADVHESIGVAETAGYRRAVAAEDLARAQTEIARRGLVATVVARYDAVVMAGRKLATANQAVVDANQFLTITRDREAGGEAAHADVIKAQLEVEARQRSQRDAQLALSTARSELAVVIFPTYDDTFQVADDLDTLAPLPGFDAVEELAAQHDPALAAASAALRQAEQDVWVTRGEMLPSLSLDYFYGIDANQFATTFDGIRNLGSSVVASVSLPLWNWGATGSRLAAARLRESQARVDLAYAARRRVADLHTFYDEADTARDELASLDRSVDLAAESLRLTLLRYQAGEATALEVVDAQNAAIDARNAADDGRARYHAALATLQTLTGALP